MHETLLYKAVGALEQFTIPDSCKEARASETSEEGTIVGHANVNAVGEVRAQARCLHRQASALIRGQTYVGTASVATCRIIPALFCILCILQLTKKCLL